MQITKKTKVTHTNYYVLELTEEEAQALYDTTGNIGGLPTNSDGSISARGHMSAIHNSLYEQFNFKTVHPVSSSMYFITK